MTSRLSRLVPKLNEPMFALGLDETGSPRGARFRRYNSPMASDVLDLRLGCVIYPSSDFAKAAKKLPVGRHHPSGTITIPIIEEALLDELMSILSKPDDTSHAYWLEKWAKRVDDIAASRGDEPAFI
jgi:hypothetical protein